MIEHERRLRALLPQARVHPSGSASVPALVPCDLDLVVLVDDVDAAAEALRREFPVLYPDEWREDWAAFRDPGHHRLGRELLAIRPDLLDEYRLLKATSGDYERRKREFFERVVGLL
jgi:hypothetical protein